jgi:hypothetical protein
MGHCNMQSSSDLEKYSPHDGYLLGLLFSPEEGSSAFLYFIYIYIYIYIVYCKCNRMLRYRIEYVSQKTSLNCRRSVRFVPENITLHVHP